MRKKALYASVIFFGFIIILVFSTSIPLVPPESADPPGLEDESEPPVMFKISFQCGHEFSYSPHGGQVGLLGLLGLGDEAIVWNEEIFETSATGLMKVGLVAHDCRECQTHIFVGVKDGYVAVYKGLPRENAQLREITDIPLSRLPLDLQEELKHGIYIRSEEDLARFLEGIDR